MNQVLLDTAEITRVVRSQRPDCTGAVLVGSAVTRSARGVADIDITAFDPTVQPGADRSTNFLHHDLPVHVVAYNVSHFLVVAESELLTFAYIREIKKLLRGIVLFDDAEVVARSLQRIRGCSVAPRLLAPLVAAADPSQMPPETVAESRLSFYRAVDSMAFAWLHLRPEYSYSKPKWLQEDAKAVHSPALEGLLHAVSGELEQRHDIGQLVERVASALPRGNNGAWQQCLNHLADARALVKAGCRGPAVFPLRMAVYQACELWAASVGLRYADLRDIARLLPGLDDVQPLLVAAVRDSLLLQEPVPPMLRHGWEEAYDGFLQEWRSFARPGEDRDGFVAR